MRIRDEAVAGRAAAERERDAALGQVANLTTQLESYRASHVQDPDAVHQRAADAEGAASELQAAFNRVRSENERFLLQVRELTQQLRAVTDDLATVRHDNGEMIQKLQDELHKLKPDQDGDHDENL